MTPAERLRKNQRLLDKGIRELDQQRVKLERQEKQLVTQIKQSQLQKISLKIQACHRDSATPAGLGLTMIGSRPDVPNK